MNVPPFDDYLGLEIRPKEAGTVEVTLDLEQHHRNLRGVAHGGVVLSMLDSALGAAVISAIPDAWWCATTSLSTNFIAGTGEGKLTATGRVLRRGWSVAYASGEVRDERGKLIATAQGSWHLWTRKPGSGDADGSVILRDGERVRVGKIVAVGRNYAKHVAEMGAPAGGPPVVFLKPPGAIVHDGGRVAIPENAGEMHHEVELVALIGEGGKSIPVERALDHVQGFAVGLDMTLRDVQAEAKSGGKPWSLAKGFDGSAPVSPVVPREQVGDGSDLAISLDVNGERRQEGNTSQMLRSVAELVAHVSNWMTLDPGDLIFTGTPSGVGPVKAGDRLEARIEKIGELTVTIEADPPNGNRVENES